jgi:hypothetical protein
MARYEVEGIHGVTQLGKYGLPLGAVPYSVAASTLSLSSIFQRCHLKVPNPAVHGQHTLCNEVASAHPFPIFRIPYEGGRQRPVFVLCCWGIRLEGGDSTEVVADTKAVFFPKSVVLPL